MTEPAAPITITSTFTGIAVAGEIDALTAPALATALEAAGEHDPLVVDLAGVEFIDSSGLRALLEVHQSRTAAGRGLVFSRPSKAVSRLFDVAGVAEYLDVVSDPNA